MTRGRCMTSRMARDELGRRLMIAVTAVVLSVCISCTASSQPGRGTINVYFNHSISREHVEPRRNLANGQADLQAVIISRIDAAESTIDLAVQEFNLVRIANALKRAKDRGVEVRCIFENNYTEPGFRPLSDEEYGDLSEAKRTEYDRERAELDVNGDDTVDETEIRASIPMVAVLDTLEKYDIPWIDDTEDGSRGSDLMHNKFAIFDAGDRRNAWVLTGSTNWTQSGIVGDLDETGRVVSDGNANNLVEIQSRDLAGIYLGQFQEMWGDGPGGENDSRFGVWKTPSVRQRVTVGGVEVEVQFSPHSRTVAYDHTVNGSIIQAIGQSESSIHMAQFSFSAQELADAIKEKWDTIDGYDVQGVFDSISASRSFSETLDMIGADSEESGHNPWDPPCNRIYKDGLAYSDKLHHKYAVIDGEVVITGSHNWSAAANHKNDENTLFIYDTKVANQYEQEFQARVAEGEVLTVGD